MKYLELANWPFVEIVPSACTSSRGGYSAQANEGLSKSENGQGLACARVHAHTQQIFSHRDGQNQEEDVAGPIQHQGGTGGVTSQLKRICGASAPGRKAHPPGMLTVCPPRASSLPQTGSGMRSRVCPRNKQDTGVSASPLLGSVNQSQSLHLRA